MNKKIAFAVLIIIVLVAIGGGVTYYQSNCTNSTKVILTSSTELTPPTSICKKTNLIIENTGETVVSGHPTNLVVENDDDADLDVAFSIDPGSSVTIPLDQDNKDVRYYIEVEGTGKTEYTFQYV